jgi:hypothetical protein
MSSLPYRKQRIENLANAWGANKVNDLFIEWQIPESLLHDLQRTVCLYVARALHFEYSENEPDFIQRLDCSRNNRVNVTPNGAVVPKCEYSLEYNLFLRSWCNIVRTMTQGSPKLLKKFRLTPNVRIKFSQEIEENIGRGLDTAIPHSDAWVEGPWGMNCHVPIIGDTSRNYLSFYKLRDESLYKDSFLENSAEYTNMQWVVNFYEEDSLIPKRNFVSVSDYALIHKTKRLLSAGTRVSIDTTIFAGDHEVHPDRNSEYLDEIPSIGEGIFVACSLSEKECHVDKKTVFSHYTSETLKHITIR